jgi:hypothetical protein
VRAVPVVVRERLAIGGVVREHERRGAQERELVQRRAECRENGPRAGEPWRGVAVRAQDAGVRVARGEGLDAGGAGSRDLGPHEHDEPRRLDERLERALGELERVAPAEAGHQRHVARGRLGLAEQLGRQRDPARAAGHAVRVLALPVVRAPVQARLGDEGGALARGTAVLHERDEHPSERIDRSGPVEEAVEPGRAVRARGDLAPRVRLRAEAAQLERARRGLVVDHEPRRHPALGQRLRHRARAHHVPAPNVRAARRAQQDLAHPAPSARPSARTTRSWSASDSSACSGRLRQVRA